MTDNDSPQVSDPQTPMPNSDFDYLPSPPVTPIFKRIQADPERQVTFDEIFHSAPSSDDIPSIPNLLISGKPRRGRPIGSRNSSKTSGRKPHSFHTIATSKKPSVRRQ